MFSEHSIVLHQKKRSTQVKIRRLTEIGEIDFSTQKWHLYNSHPRTAVASKPKVLVHRQRSYSQLTLKPHSSLRHIKTRKTNPYFSKIKKTENMSLVKQNISGLLNSHPNSTHKKLQLTTKNPKTCKKTEIPPHIENSKASPQAQKPHNPCSAYQRRPRIDEHPTIAPATEEALYKCKERQTLTLIFHEQSRYFFFTGLVLG